MTKEKEIIENENENEIHLEKQKAIDNHIWETRHQASGGTWHHPRKHLVDKKEIKESKSKKDTEKTD